MRTQYLSVVVFIQFSEGTAASAIVDGTHLKESSSNLTTIPHPSETAFMAENYLEPYDSSVDKADGDSSVNTTSRAVKKSEERMPNKSWVWLKEVLGGQQMKDLTLEQAFDKLNGGRTTGNRLIGSSGFKRWIQFVDKRQTDNDEDVVKLLIKRVYDHQTSEVGTSERVKSTVQLITKSLADDEDRANRMLYLLFRSNPSDFAIPIMDAWLKKKVHPNEVYRILRVHEAIVAEFLLQYPVLWLRYIVKYNELEKVSPYSMETAVEQLQEDMGLQFQTSAFLKEIKNHKELDVAAENLKTLIRSGKSELLRSKTTRRRRKSNNEW